MSSISSTAPIPTPTPMASLTRPEDNEKASKKQLSKKSDSCTALTTIVDGSNQTKTAASVALVSFAQSLVPQTPQAGVGPSSNTKLTLIKTEIRNREQAEKADQATIQLILAMKKNIEELTKKNAQLSTDLIAAERTKEVDKAVHQAKEKTSQELIETLTRSLQASQKEAYKYQSHFQGLRNTIRLFPVQPVHDGVIFFPKWLIDTISND